MTLVVSPALLTIASGITAVSKVYDGTTVATLNFNNVELAGVVNGDTVSVITNGYVASFASASLGNGVAVTVSGLTLTGAAATNYTLTQPENLIANIISPAMRISAASPNILISWTTNASVYVLEGTASLVPPVKWSVLTNSIAVIGTNNTVLVNAASGFHYFELVAPP